MIVNSVYFTILGFEDLKWRIEQLRAVLYKWRTLDQLKNNREGFRHNGIEGCRLLAGLQLKAGHLLIQGRRPCAGLEGTRCENFSLNYSDRDLIQSVTTKQWVTKLLDSSLNLSLHWSIKAPLVWTWRSILEQPFSCNFSSIAFRIFFCKHFSFSLLELREKLVLLKTCLKNPCWRLFAFYFHCNTY